MSAVKLPEFDSNAHEAPLVCACVITYNGKKFLDRCFHTLRQTDYENLRLILVDNGSSDGSGDYVRQSFPDVDVLRVFPNAGFPHGANEAIAQARQRDATYILLLNDDIAILHPQWLREAVAYAEHDPRIGIIGFDQVTSDDKPTAPPVSTLIDAMYLGSAAMMMPVDLFDRIGTFDELYHVMADDDDITARAQAAGYRTAKLSIPIYHYGGGTNQAYGRKTAYLQIRNAIRFSLKNRSLAHALMRTLRIVDIACNPWPVTFEAGNIAHRRMRNSGNVFVNLLLWVRAVSWNIVRLPQTFHIRAADRRLIRAARAASTQTCSASAMNSRVRTSPAGQLTY
jgi:GT2 family glycosyltransferase